MPAEPTDLCSPPLDRAGLARLRDAVQAVRDERGGPLPHRALLRLTEVTGDALVTIDFEAEETLGMPMVVLTTAPDGEAPVPLLSAREHAVAALIAEGLANKEIAARLGLALATIKDHVHRILKKTGLPNRAAIAALLTAGRRR